MNASNKKPRRILIGFTEVAGYFEALRRGFGELGVAADFADLYGHKFQYASAPAPLVVRCVRWLIDQRAAAASRRAASRHFWIGAEALARGVLFLYALALYDVWILTFASSFFGHHDVELRIARLFGKRVIYVFCGSDSRPSYIDGSQMAAEHGRTVRDCIALTAELKRRVNTIEKYAHAVVQNPLTAHFHQKPFVQWIVMGIPSGAEIESRLLRRDGARIRILHAPSLQEAKGTPIVRAAVEELRVRGYDVDYVEISGRPHHEIVSAIENCDVVIDQVYNDTPLAIFATEAARCAKPAVVGTYGAAEMARQIPEWAMPPVLLSHPDRLADAAELLIRDGEYRKNLGNSAYRFVSEHWTAAAVAERYLRLVSDDIPDDWFSDPRDIRYLHGWGMPEARSKQLIRDVISQAGVEALCLSDKPELERAMVRFAQEPVVTADASVAARTRENAAC